MIKLYQLGWNEIKETEAERETANFWIINGQRVAKVLPEYPDQAWYLSPEAAIKAVIVYKASQRDKYLVLAQQNQDEIDKLSVLLNGLGVD
jgi:hypothetical protein